MAKNIYKIPISLARSFLDHEIALSAKGWQAKPLAIKVLLFWTGSMFGMFWLLTASYLKHANIGLNILIAIWWIIATAFLGKYSKTKELNVRNVPSLLNYFQRGARRVETRSAADPSGFYTLVNLDDVDDDGVITWNDGTVGKAFLVVGSASILVFDQDKIAILNRVDKFYRKVDTTVELSWITTKEPQRVYRQLYNLDRLNQNLAVEDPELQELLEERWAILTGYVGGLYNSIHQYLVIKADSVEALRRTDVIVQTETEESALMIKQLTGLNGAETTEMFRRVYGGTN